MFCSSCGTKLNDGARFCPNCGTMQNAAPQAPVSQQPKAAYPPAAPQAAPAAAPAPAGQSAPKAKKNRLPLILGIAGGATVLLVLIAVLAIILTRSGSDLSKNYVFSANEMIMVREEGIFGDTEYFLTDGKDIKISMFTDDSPEAVIYDELTRTEGFYVDFPNDAYWNEDEEYVATLYHFGKNGESTIATNVDRYLDSADGSAVFYAQRAPFYSEYEPAVNLRVYKNGKDTEIDMMDYLESYCISPDGSAIYYSGTGTLGHKSVIYVNGKKTDLPENFHPGYVFGITNDGKTLYYYDESYDGFYVWNDGETIRLGSYDYDGSITKYFNLDCTQVIYHNEGQTYLWSRDGSEKTKLSPDVLYLLLPSRILHWGISEDTFTHFVGIKDFKNTFLVSNDSTCYLIDSHHELQTVIRDYTYLELANDGKTLVVLKREKIYRFDGTKEYKDPSKTEIASGYVSFAMTADAKEIYVIDKYNDLYYLGGSSKPVLVGENITYNYFFSSSVMTLDGRLYYISHGELYWAKGSSMTQVTGFEGEAEEVYSALNAASLYTSDGSSDYYYTVYPDGDVVLAITWN